MTRAPRALLVDLDDTLIASAATLGEPCWVATCEALAPKVGVSADLLYRKIRVERETYWADPERHRLGRLDLAAKRRLIVSQALRALELDDSRHCEPLAAGYEARFEAAMDLFPGAIDALVALRERGVLLALVTNGSSVVQRRKIERFGLAQYFSLLQIEGEFGKGKPEPEVYRFVLDRLGVGARDSWMIGDHLEWDVAAPQREGIFGIWRDPHGRGLPEGCKVKPGHVVKSMQELVSACAAWD